MSNEHEKLWDSPEREAEKLERALATWYAAFDRNKDLPVVDRLEAAFKASR